MDYRFIYERHKALRKHNRRKSLGPKVRQRVFRLDNNGTIHNKKNG